MFRLFRLAGAGGCNALRAQALFKCLSFRSPPPLPSFFEAGPASLELGSQLAVLPSKGLSYGPRKDAMTAHRGIATLASALLICFLLLSHFEPEFFLLHLYQSLIYLVIVLLLFYFEDRWAYMIGILAPAVWLLLNYATGELGGAMRQVSRLMRAQRPTNEVTMLAAVIAALAVLMIVSCAYRWKREYAGLGKGLRTFFVSLGIVIAYYVILVAWFWRMVPQGT